MKKVVVIGGGTGISAILKGIKKYSSNITAVVTMADDGGGSGILRQDMGILPPGDVRNCIVALSETEGVMENLLQYRFETGGLKGQNFGNILIAALCDIYGSFNNALNQVENIFSMSGRVVPVTYENVHLVAEFENGDKCIGESIIPKMAYKLDTRIKNISLFPQIPKASSDALLAIKEADLIIIGPGSLYTSIIPNLVVDGINDALRKSSGQKVYILNVMTELGETLGFNIRDHVEAIVKHSYEGIIDKIIINNKKPSEEMIKNYLKISRSTEVKIDEDGLNYLKSKGIGYILGDFIEEKDTIRHSGEKIAKGLLDAGLL
ncbi:gluconeogenesis factor YvcK family protein [Peptoniphilus catoniae]|uniref:gluconeogenesis factor YvcK family protein n=1 Tax=Peptoniphilus catoniae TaxID=1660341 RepID=UPI0010FF12E9|nr:gluconeogenesis factor YvcK family protein [Peptoniphilus catoniae]